MCASCKLDISPEAISQNVPAEVALVGDGKAIVGQMNKALEGVEWFYPKDTEWHSAIAAEIRGERETDPDYDRRRVGADQLLPRVP
jgi:2-hydroxyacyl-CoA lyase 1